MEIYVETTPEGLRKLADTIERHGSATLHSVDGDLIHFTQEV